MEEVTNLIEPKPPDAIIAKSANNSNNLRLPTGRRKSSWLYMRAGKD